MSKAAPVLALAIILGGVSLAPGVAAAADDRSILTYHGAADRSGNFIVPGLTAERARGLHLDNGFQARLSGHLYAQPLFWREAAAGADLIIAVSAFTAGQVERHLNVPRERIRVVHHGVLPRSLPNLPREKVVLCVGAIQRRKNMAIDYAAKRQGFA